MGAILGRGTGTSTIRVTVWRVRVRVRLRVRVRFRVRVRVCLLRHVGGPYTCIQGTYIHIYYGMSVG